MTRNSRETEEAAIAAYVARGLVKKLPPVADPFERFDELRRELVAKFINSTFRKPRGRSRKSR